MKKKIVCLTLALLMTASQAVSVSASREDDLREEQAITSQQLDATYSRMDELANAKAQLESEISELDSNLVNVMVSIDTLKNDISNKEVDIIRTKQDLAKAQKARDKYPLGAGARRGPPHDRAHGRAGPAAENPGERGLPAPGLSHFPVHRHDRNRGLCQYLPLWNRR